MPAINTSSLPNPEVERYVKEAYVKVDTGPRVGIIRERNSGMVPVHIDSGNPGYGGVTEFEYRPGEMGIEAVRVGINHKLPTYRKLGQKWLNVIGRVAEHEFSHVKSEGLLKYMLDLPDNQRTLLMESYAEFSGIRRGKKEDVLLTTPYTPAVKFAYFADRFYESKVDRQKGYEAFIRDIQLYGSARKALRNLGANIKAAVDQGIDVIGVTEGKYNSEVMDARRRVGADIAAYPMAA